MMDEVSDQLFAYLLCVGMAIQTKDKVVWPFQNDFVLLCDPCDKAWDDIEDGTPCPDCGAQMEKIKEENDGQVQG